MLDRDPSATPAFASAERVRNLARRLRTINTLTTPAALIAAGLAAPERARELEAVAARYAIARAARARRTDRPRRSRRSDRAPVPARPARTRSRPRRTRRSHRRRAEEPGARAWCIATATACWSSSSRSARSIAGSVSGARWSGPARPGSTRRAFAGRARLYRRASGNLGGRADRRRPARAVAAPARRPSRARSPKSRMSKCCAGTRGCRWRRPSASPPALARALTGATARPSMSRCTPTIRAN